jgi:predicted secreted acid phosphatase
MRLLLTFFSCLFLFSFSFSTFAEPRNIFHVHEGLVKYYETGEYAEEIQTQVSQAKRYLNQALTNKNLKGKRLAVVFDIDETLLSGFYYMKQLKFGGTLKQIYAIADRDDLPAIKSMRDLFLFAQKNGYAVFLLTGRLESDRASTIKNLHREGMSGWKQLYLRPKKVFKTTIAYKSAMRRRIEENGYVIVLSMGDQESDLQGGYAIHPLKLPNPFYLIP